MYIKSLLPKRIEVQTLPSPERRGEIAKSSVKAASIPVNFHYTRKSPYKLEGNKLFLPRIRPNFITKRQMEDLYSRTLAARVAIKRKEREVKKRNSRLDEKALQDSRHEVMKSFFQPLQGNKDEEYLNHPVIRQVITDSISGDYAKTTSLAGAYNTNFRLSPFQLYKETSPSLGFFAFRNIEIPENLRRHFPSQARSIDVYRASPGLTNPDLVASFTDFIPSSRKNDPNAPAYYKVNRFLTRTLNTLKPVIKKHVSGNIFKNLLDAKNEDIMVANAIWLTRHEFEHGKDRLPLLFREDNVFGSLDDNEDTKARRVHNAQAGHALKNNRNGGAWEELRVDLKVILSAYGDKSSTDYGHKAKHIVRNLVLAERLLGYACRLDKEEFDAKTSAILRNFLLDRDVITINNRNILTVKEDMVEAGLRDLLTEMERIEEEISTGPKLELEKAEQRKKDSEFKKARKKIDDFVEEWSVKKQEGNGIKATRSRNFVKATKRTVNSLGRRFSRASESLQRRYRDSLLTTINNRPGKASDAVREDVNPMPNIDNNTEIILYDLDREDIPELARSGDYKTVAELDREFADYISSYSDQNPNVIDPAIKLLKAMLSKTDTLDKDFPDEIIYYATADVKNELDQDDIGLYRKLILDLLNDCFKDEFQAYCKVFSFGNEDLNDKFFSRIERILRCKFRPEKENGLLEDKNKSLIDKKRELGEIKVREELKPKWLNEGKTFVEIVKERPGTTVGLSGVAIGLIGLITLLVLPRTEVSVNPGRDKNTPNATRNDNNTVLHPVRILHQNPRPEPKEYSEEFLIAAKAGLDNPFLCSKNRSLGRPQNLTLNLEINEEEIDLGNSLKMTVPVDLKPETKEFLADLFKALLYLDPKLNDTLIVYRIEDLTPSYGINIRGAGKSVFITKEHLGEILERMRDGENLVNIIKTGY